MNLEIGRILDQEALAEPLWGRMEQNVNSVTLITLVTLLGLFNLIS